jgi:hypothetical protein
MINKTKFFYTFFNSIKELDKIKEVNVLKKTLFNTMNVVSLKDFYDYNSQIDSNYKLKNYNDKNKEAKLVSEMKLPFKILRFLTISPLFLNYNFYPYFKDIKKDPFKEKKVIIRLRNI